MNNNEFTNEMMMSIDSKSTDIKQRMIRIRPWRPYHQTSMPRFFCLIFFWRRKKFAIVQIFYQIIWCSAQLHIHVELLVHGGDLFTHNNIQIFYAINPNGIIFEDRAFDKIYIVHGFCCSIDIVILSSFSPAHLLFTFGLVPHNSPFFRSTVAWAQNLSNHFFLEAILFAVLLIESNLVWTDSWLSAENRP